MNNSQWVHLYRGLVEPKHVRRMGESVWVYLYFLANADRKTGIVFRKRETIAKDLGLCLRSVQNHVERLRIGGYITTSRRQYSLVIQITNWRSLPDFRESRQKMKKMVRDLSGEMSKRLHF